MESTPTFGGGLPAFEGMIFAWEAYQLDHPQAKTIVQQGLDKLAEYKEFAKVNKVYTLMTSKLLIT